MERTLAEWLTIVTELAPIVTEARKGGIDKSDVVYLQPAIAVLAKHNVTLAELADFIGAIGRLLDKVR